MSIDDFFERNELNSEELKQHGFEYRFNFADLQVYRQDDYLYAFEHGENKLRLYMKFYEQNKTSE